jgi:hypothetical protein
MRLQLKHINKPARAVGVLQTLQGISGTSWQASHRDSIVCASFVRRNLSKKGQYPHHVFLQRVHVWIRESGDVTCSHPVQVTTHLAQKYCAEYLSTCVSFCVQYHSLQALHARRHPWAWQNGSSPWQGGKHFAHTRKGQCAHCGNASQHA